jgi:hypothetical protein
MLETDQIARMREAADTPSDNVQVEEMRGYLGQALDALAEVKEYEARKDGGFAQRLVMELHKSRRR